MINQLKVVLTLGLALGMFVACGEETVVEANLNELLQGGKSQGGSGTWKSYNKSTEENGDKVETTYTLVFHAPDSYRIDDFTLLNGEQVPELDYEEAGRYDLTEDDTPEAGATNSGQMSFMPADGDAWAGDFKILIGSGDLVLVYPDGRTVQYTYLRVHWD
ncbi:hypothetical protein ACFLT7_08645 [candidate division KSB1 bacterium]